MADADPPKREATPTAVLSSIPQKRALDEVHSPAVPSPLNPDSQNADDSSNANRKPTRMKKESFKKRDARAGDSAPATPKAKRRGDDQSTSGPLRYKLAPPKPSDFDAPRGPALALKSEMQTEDGRTVEFFETSDQCVDPLAQLQPLHSR